MNLLDLALLIGVIACAAWGAKRGFVRMLMITIGLMAAIIVAVHYNDTFARELAAYFHGSPVWVTMWAFVFSSMLLFALFRLGAKLFYRVANVQKMGKHDQFGGALVGLVFGWLMMGYLVFLSMFLPLPYMIEEKFDTTIFATKMGASIPFLYESTAKLHPSQEEFMGKMQDAMAVAMESTKSTRSAGRRARTGASDQSRVDDVLDRIERYFVADF